MLEALKDERELNFAILPDHPVPIKLRKHTTTPVPVAMCGTSFEADEITRFSETDAPHGLLGFMSGGEIVRKVLALD